MAAPLLSVLSILDKGSQSVKCAIPLLRYRVQILLHLCDRLQVPAEQCLAAHAQAMHQRHRVSVCPTIRRADIPLDIV